MLCTAAPVCTSARVLVYASNNLIVPVGYILCTYERQSTKIVCIRTYSVFEWLFWRLVSICNAIFCGIYFSQSAICSHRVCSTCACAFNTITVGGWLLTGRFHHQYCTFKKLVGKLRWQETALEHRKNCIEDGDKNRNNYIHAGSFRSRDFYSYKGTKFADFYGK